MSEHRRAVVAFDIGGHNCRSALIDGQGKIHGLEHRPMEVTDASRALEMLVSRGHSLIALAKSKGLVVEGIGVAVPGFLNEHGGWTYLHNVPALEKLALRQHFSDTFGLPCSFENDANCALLGEVWLGAAQGYEHVIALTLGTGVGGALWLNGQLYKGKHGGAGELGHVMVDPLGPTCGCGRKGCLESFLSANALEQTYGQSLKKLSEMAHQGDAAALKLFETYGQYLGRGLADLILAFDPEIVLLGGKVALSWALFQSETRRVLLNELPNHPNREPTIMPFKHIAEAGLLGAAALVLLQFNKGV